MAAKKAAKRKLPKRQVVSKSELIDTGTNKLFARRNKRGTSFEKVVDVGRSLSADRRRSMHKIVAHGVKAGWLETQDGQSVCLTHAGRRLTLPS